MHKQFDDLFDKAFDLRLELEKIDVLISDLYANYFSLIDIYKPEAVDLMMHNFKSSYIKCIMIKDLITDVSKLSEEISKEIDNLQNNDI